MNRNKTDSLIRQNLPFYLAALLLLFFGKYLYSRAGSDDLKWILWPTAQWVRLLSGIPFVYVQDFGYVNHDLRILIAPSCSGVQFMLIAAVTLIFSYVHRTWECTVIFGRRSLRAARPCLEAGVFSHASRTKKGVCWIFFSILLSYLYTILVNGLRIIAAIYLPSLFDRLGLLGPLLTPQRLHTAVGVVVYFASLLSLCQLAGRLFQKPVPTSAALQQTAGREPQESSPGRPAPACLKRLASCPWLAPAFWYFAVVLGIPALNNALKKDFALLTVLCCGAVLTLFRLAAAGRKYFRRKADT